MKKKENQFVSLIFNILIPILVMSKMSGTEGMFAVGPKISLGLAVSFPLVYGIYSFIKERKVNFISVLGLVSVLLTGIMGMFKEISPLWFAVKEAAVPAVIAIVVLISIRMNRNVVKKLLFNEDIMDMEKVHAKLDENGQREQFDTTITKASYWVAFSFVISSLLNFILARIILKGIPGTEIYDKQIAKMMALSFPVIALPCTIILVLVFLYVLKKIKTLTGIEFEEIIKK